MKAQAAMEQLVVFAWVFSIILVVVASLAYFGVFNAKKHVPNICDTGLEILCVDFAPTATQVSLVLHAGSKKEITNIRIVGCSGNSSGIIDTNQDQTFIVGQCDFEKGLRTISDINITYTSPTGLAHNIKGKLNFAVS